MARADRPGWMERRNPPGIYDSHYHAIAQQPPPGALTFMAHYVKAALTTYLAACHCQDALHPATRGTRPPATPGTSTSP